MDPETQRRAHAKAEALGISFAEYVRRLVADDLHERPSKQNVSLVFNLVMDGEPTDIAHDKDKMIGEAMWDEYLRETGRRSSKSTKTKQR